MKHLVAAVLMSATFACSKTDSGTTAAPAADPAPAPVAPAPAPAAAPASAPAAAPVAEAPTPAESEPAPDLVEAAPGVQVVADYDAPVFYSDGQYWRENSGRWYASAHYTGGWEYRATPPTAIVHIDRPERFVHYRPSGYVVRSRPAPSREWHPEVRADVRVETPREVRVEPRTEVRVEPPRANVRVDAPRAEVHVETPRVRVELPHAEVRVGH